MEGMSEETTGGVSDWCTAAGDGPFFLPAVGLEDNNNQKGDVSRSACAVKTMENEFGVTRCSRLAAVHSSDTDTTVIKVNSDVSTSCTKSAKKRTFRYSESQTSLYTKTFIRAKQMSWHTN